MSTRGTRHGLRPHGLLAGLLALGLVAAACAPSAPSSPTAAPAKPPPTSAPAQQAKPETAQPATAAEKPAQKPAAKADIRAVEDFYKGKTIKVIVATTAGSLFDAWGRLLARHMPKYIPGNPNMIVENMPGAGHLIAANHLYTAAPKDGTVIGTFVETQAINQLVGAKGVEFDMTKFQWLGATKGAVNACLARTDLAKVSQFSEVVGPNGKEVIFATTGPGSSGYEYPLLFKELLGANIKLVSGYKGNQEVRLAIENGEAEAYCASWDAVARGVQPWKEAGKPPFSIIIQAGVEKAPELKEVPLARELAKTEDDKAMFRLMDGPNNFAKPYAAPPGTPEERVGALREAFMAAFKDPELIAEAKKADMDFDPRTGAQLLAGFGEVLKTPKPVVERYKQLVGR